MRIEKATTIDAPIARVWALTLDIEGLPSITPTIRRADRDGDEPVAVGTTARLKQPGMGSRRWTVTTVDPERRFAWESRLPGLRMLATHDLAAIDAGTRNTLTLELSGPLAKVLGPLMRRRITKALATESAGFKAAAEAPAGGMPG